MSAELAGPPHHPGMVTGPGNIKGPIKPPVPYFGGKQRIAARIAALLPAHDHYVEPFAGGLSILLAKAPSKMETVNDLDSDLMIFWKVLRDSPEDLARVCYLTPHSRAELAASRCRDDTPDDLERARRVWVQLTQGRAGTLLSTGWRYHEAPAGSTGSMGKYLDGYLARVAPAAARLRSVSLECRPALDLITAYGAHHGVLLYVDPPYLGSTRTGRGYRHEMHTTTEHQVLAKVLHQCKAAVVLSGYASELYEELYSGWHRHTLAASTGQGSVWGTRTEVLWSNTPLTQDLFTTPVDTVTPEPEPA